MSKGLNKINNGFKKGFNSVYYAKVHCPVCKEEIYANALICPNCKTDFRKPTYAKLKSWQSNAMRIVLAVSALIAFAICISGVPIVLGIFVGLALYGGGYVIIQKIQSFKNYHKK